MATFFEPIKIGFWETFCAQFSGGGAKLVFLIVVFGQKRGFPQKIVHLLLGEFRLYFLAAMMSLDALEGCAKTLLK